MASRKAALSSPLVVIFIALQAVPVSGFVSPAKSWSAVIGSCGTALHIPGLRPSGGSSSRRMQCTMVDEAKKSVVRVVGAVMQDGDSVLMAQRPQGKSYAGLWEFPGGKVENGETDEEALARECMEELGVEVVVGDLLGEGSDGHIQLRCYQAEIVSGSIQMLEHADMKWFQRSKLPFDQTPPADTPILEALQRQDPPGAS